MNILPQSGKSLLPSLVKVRPMLLLTGFLGAGKTTFLRDMLAHLATREYRADVILNDRENAFIDKETLKGHAADISALTASCVCCDGYEDLVTMILKASESQHDILVIELNGTADPIPLQESFTLLESKFFLRPRWQICVIDARYFRKRRRFNDLESLQLETASHYFISHSSRLTEKEGAELEGAIKTINSGASRTTASLLVDALSQAIASNSWPQWVEYNKMIGLGGWGGRNEKSGPYVYYNDAGKLIRDTSKGKGGSHGPKHEFVITTRDQEHPITRGLPAQWMHSKDECYSHMRGPAEHMTILATGCDTPASQKEGRHEPMLMVLSYGKGRVFHTMLGDNVPGFEGVGFIETFLRGAEWAATGKVTREIPKDFPTKQKSSSRLFKAITD